jgi:hypothetical protein
MHEPVSFTASMIAPCGINCGTCMAFLRKKNRCLGCRVDFDEKHETCKNCKIKNCSNLKTVESGFCFDCGEFPCQKISHIDKRYRTKYRSGLISNLLFIKEKGMVNFLAEETVKWKCPNCGATTSIHRDYCFECLTKVK